MCSDVFKLRRKSQDRKTTTPINSPPLPGEQNYNPDGGEFTQHLLNTDAAVAVVAVDLQTTPNVLTLP